MGGCVGRGSEVFEEESAWCRRTGREYRYYPITASVFAAKRPKQHHDDCRTLRYPPTKPQLEWTTCGHFPRIVMKCRTSSPRSPLRSGGTSASWMRAKERIKLAYCSNLTRFIG